MPLGHESIDLERVAYHSDGNRFRCDDHPAILRASELPALLSGEVHKQCDAGLAVQRPSWSFCPGFTTKAEPGKPFGEFFGMNDRCQGGTLLRLSLNCNR